jgi:hypothetical protein
MQAAGRLHDEPARCFSCHRRVERDLPQEHHSQVLDGVIQVLRLENQDAAPLLLGLSVGLS